MAVSKNRNARRMAGLALAISAIALPGVALADPDHEGRSRGSRSEEGGHQERQQNQGNPGWRGQQRQESIPAPAPQAAPQAQAQWQGRADRGDRGSRGGWGGNYAAPQAAPVPAPQPAQQGWNGGNRQDRNWNRDGDRRQAERAPAWSGQRSWNDGDRRDHDGNRDGDRRWDRSRSSGYVQNGTYYGTSNGYNRDRRDWDHDGDGDHRWDRRWRDNRSYNWYSYRSSHPSYFRLGAYYAPYRDYSYRRLSIGIYLDSLFFSQNYWIDNPGYYRLPDVYGPYRWVRYYDDALLVDIYSGEVVDVIYDFFW